MNAVDWRDGALCAQIGGNAWFPNSAQAAAEARRICAVCDVRPECLEHALTYDERFGIWAGLSQAQLDRIRRPGDGRDSQPAPTALGGAA